LQRIAGTGSRNEACQDNHHEQEGHIFNGSSEKRLEHQPTD
jgi:hypothetical protein